MANYGAMLRPTAALWAVHFHVRSTQRAISRFAGPSSFSLPAGCSSATNRIRRNFTVFRVHYAILLWFILLSTLFRSHRASMLFLMAASKIALSYAVLLRIFPNSSLLRRFLDRHLVAVIFLTIVVVDLSLDSAIRNLFLSLIVATPFVLAHAVFRIPEAPPADEDGKIAGDRTPISDKVADLEVGQGDRSS
ncbi:hypothetical protein HPP92_025412 [Vanilla planifolia]|uniref:PRA1 family protein n=1 Tax=Vanilla planifolia TaxID=51239 RepID=A0A835PK23_VANPL|nr:hypothetical protein HPP92_025412 [Vanilla planifolia]